jgi:hypothetical protein
MKIISRPYKLQNTMIPIPNMYIRSFLQEKGIDLVELLTYWRVTWSGTTIKILKEDQPGEKTEYKIIPRGTNESAGYYITVPKEILFAELVRLNEEDKSKITAQWVLDRDPKIIFEKTK